VSTLAQLVDEIEAELKDSANAVWSAAELEDHVAKALRDVSLRRPQMLATTLTTGTVRELAHSVADLYYVTDVWFPYDTASPTWPPTRPKWFIPVAGYIFLDVTTAPTAGQKARVFYAAPHTIQNLESAAATSLDKHGETLVILGASAYAALQECQHIIGAVTVNDRTQEQYIAWAKMRMDMFQAALARLEPDRMIPYNGGPVQVAPSTDQKGGL
jgi:hypothetical protein